MCQRGARWRVNNPTSRELKSEERTTDEFLKVIKKEGKKSV